MTTRRRILFLSSLIIIIGLSLFLYRIKPTLKEKETGGTDRKAERQLAIIDQMKKDALRSNAPKGFIAQLEDLEIPEGKIPDFIISNELNQMSAEEWKAFETQLDQRLKKWKEESKNRPKTPPFDLKLERQKFDAWRKKVQEQEETSRKYREKLLRQIESLGGVLVYDENGNPIGYEKDENGRPIRRDIQAETQTRQPMSSNEPQSDTWEKETFRDTLPETQETEGEALPETPTVSTDTISEEFSLPFATERWRDDLKLQVTEWNVTLMDQFPDASIASYLAPNEFEAFFPTEESRQILERQIEQMQSDIVGRVEKILSEDTTGNRSEKLSIIRQTLSKNWSPDIADGVLERLK